MVTNPYTGKPVNVLPLLKELNNGYCAEDGSFWNIIKPIQKVHDFMSTRINLNENDDPKGQFEDYKDVLYNVVNLRQVFENMAGFAD